jgi:DNA-binding MarR family transcriptional regulator
LLGPTEQHAGATQEDLLQIAKSLGRVTQELAKMLNISRPGVTRILDRLVEAGLVSRAEDAADRRRVLVYRTSDGHRYMEQLDTVAEHVASEILSDA